MVKEKQAALEKRLVEAIERAKQSGADSAEVSAGYYSGYTVSVRQGEVDTLEHYQDQRLTVTAYVGKQTGSASTTDWAPASIKAAAEKACTIAKLTEADACAGLPDRALMADPASVSDLSIYHPWSLSVDEAIALAKHCENHGLKQDARLTQSEGVDISNTERIVAYANSHGFVGSYPKTLHSQSCSFITEEGNDKQRDYEYTMARKPDALLSGEQLAEAAANLTVRRLGAKTLSSRRCAVVLPPRVSTEFMGYFISAINGYRLYQRSSFLIDAINKPIFPEWLTVEESAEIPAAMGSRPFDAEGVQRKPRLLVQEGVLKGYILDSYTGRKLNKETTGNAGGAHNIVFSCKTQAEGGNPPNVGFDELLAQMGEGLLVTETMGDGLNPVTGDYSVGAFGFWVEGGRIQYPVQGITIAGNLKQLFSGLQAVGNDTDRRGKLHVGSVLLDEMMVGGA